MARSSKSKTRKSKPDELSKALNNIKIAVCVATGGHPKPEFTHSLAILTGQFGHAGIRHIICFMTSSVIQANRQALADFVVQKTDCTHLLFIDDDMQFAPEAVKYLLGAAVPIVGVTYRKRQDAVKFTSLNENGDQVAVNEDSSGLEVVNLIGLGLTLVDVNVFKAMDRPYFDFTWNPKMSDWDGEDGYFLKKAAKCGFKTYVSLDASKYIDHIGSKAYTWKDIDWSKIDATELKAEALKNDNVASMAEKYNASIERSSASKAA